MRPNRRSTIYDKAVHILTFFSRTCTTDSHDLRYRESVGNIHEGVFANAAFAITIGKDNDRDHVSIEPSEIASPHNHILTDAAPATRRQ